MSALVADIGGTHARFARLSGDRTLTQPAVLRCAEHATLLDAIRTYLAMPAVAALGPPTDAAIAIANPVDGDRVQMTNHHWTFSIAATRDALGLRRLLVLNDFTALALALPGLGDAELRPIGAGGERRPHATIGLLGPGTGLGVSGLVRCGRRWQPLASEGGHVTLPAATDREAALLTEVRRQFPHVSAERLLSGPGLALLHEALRAIDGAPALALTPAEVSERARAGDCRHCAEATTMFSAMLGGVAGNLALTLGAFGGVYVGGGVIGALGPAFDRRAFRARFEAKGRFAGYLARIATVEIVAEHPALRGAAAALLDDAG